MCEKMAVSSFALLRMGLVLKILMIVLALPFSMAEPPAFNISCSLVGANNNTIAIKATPAKPFNGRLEVHCFDSVALGTGETTSLNLSISLELPLLLLDLDVDRCGLRFNQSSDSVSLKLWIHRHRTLTFKEDRSEVVVCPFPAINFKQRPQNNNSEQVQLTLEPQNPQKNQTTLSRIGHAFMAQFGEQYNLVVEPPNNYDPTNISIESCAAKNSSGSLQLIEVGKDGPIEPLEFDEGGRPMARIPAMFKLPYSNAMNLSCKFKIFKQKRSSFDPTTELQHDENVRTLATRIPRSVTPSAFPPENNSETSTSSTLMYTGSENNFLDEAEANSSHQTYPTKNDSSMDSVTAEPRILTMITASSEPPPLFSLMTGSIIIFIRNEKDRGNSGEQSIGEAASGSNSTVTIGTLGSILSASESSESITSICVNAQKTHLYLIFAGIAIAISLLLLACCLWCFLRTLVRNRRQGKATNIKSSASKLTAASTPSPPQVLQSQSTLVSSIYGYGNGLMNGRHSPPPNSDRNNNSSNYWPKESSPNGGGSGFHQTDPREEQPSRSSTSFFSNNNISNNGGYSSTYGHMQAPIPPTSSATDAMNNRLSASSYATVKIRSTGQKQPPITSVFENAPQYLQLGPPAEPPFVYFHQHQQQRAPPPQPALNRLSMTSSSAAGVLPPASPTATISSVTSAAAGVINSNGMMMERRTSGSRPTNHPPPPMRTFAAQQNLPPPPPPADVMTSSMSLMTCPSTSSAEADSLQHTPVPSETGASQNNNHHHRRESPLFNIYPTPNDRLLLDGEMSRSTSTFGSSRSRNESVSYL